MSCLLELPKRRTHRRGVVHGRRAETTQSDNILTGNILIHKFVCMYVHKHFRRLKLAKVQLASDVTS